MNTDRYTKVVLTIIAGCLLWMCLMSVGGRVQAQSPPQPPNSRNSGGAAQPVIIVGTGTMDLAGNVMINFTQQAGGVRRTDPTVPVQLPYSLDQPLPVGLHYTANVPMPVQITAVTKVGDWQSIRTQVEEMPPKPKPGGGGR